MALSNLRAARATAYQISGMTLPYVLFPFCNSKFFPIVQLPAKRCETYRPLQPQKWFLRLYLKSVTSIAHVSISPRPRNASGGWLKRRPNMIHWLALATHATNNGGGKPGGTRGAVMKCNARSKGVPSVIHDLGTETGNKLLLVVIPRIIHYFNSHKHKTRCIQRWLDRTKVVV